MATPLRHPRQVRDDPVSAAASTSGAPAEPDWAAQTADQIERVVVGIRSKTSEPLERLVRVVVYGLVAGALGIAALVLLAVALVRALDVALPGEVWAAHLTAGGIFTVAGLFLWSRRRRSSGD